MPEESDIPAGQPLQDWWDDFRIAAAFLTRLPVGLLGSPPASGGNLAQASRTFPLVGLLIGGISAIVYGFALDPGLTAFLSANPMVADGLLGPRAPHGGRLADLAHGLG